MSGAGMYGHVPRSRKGRCRRRLCGATGFGLVEMLVAMTVLGLMAGGVMTMLFRTQSTFEVQLVDMDMRQQARVALDTLTTELRLAGYRMDNLTDAVERAGTNVLQFVGDIDDGAAGPPCASAFEDAPNGGAERISYELVNGQLRRTVECWDGGAWTPEYIDQIVAENLVGPQALFGFFDASGTEIVPVGAELTAAQRAQVRLVGISMNMLDPAAPLVGPDARSFSLRGRIKLPNLD